MSRPAVTEEVARRLAIAGWMLTIVVTVTALAIRDIDHLRTALATTAGGAVHPSGVGVWLRPAPGTTR